MAEENAAAQQPAEPSKEAVRAPPALIIALACAGATAVALLASLLRSDRKDAKAPVSPPRRSLRSWSACWRSRARLPAALHAPGAAALRPPFESRSC